MIGSLGSFDPVYRIPETQVEMERAMGVGSCTLWWKLEQGAYTLYTKS